MQRDPTRSTPKFHVASSSLSPSKYLLCTGVSLTERGSGEDRFVRKLRLQGATKCMSHVSLLILAQYRSQVTTRKPQEHSPSEELRGGNRVKSS